MDPGLHSPRRRTEAAITTSATLPAAGATRGVLDATRAACLAMRPATLAVVTATDGSTYARAGTVALFEAGGPSVGWLSGGCLEPEIARRAATAAHAGAVDAMDIDTRDDAALFAGSAVGCRGRLHVALLPVRGMPGMEAALEAWGRGHGLQLQIASDGTVACAAGDVAHRWQLPLEPSARGVLHPGTVAIAAAPRVLCCGLGPESPVLLPWLRTLGWWVAACEPRARWQSHAVHADHVVGARWPDALHGPDGVQADAALVMHHDFERDRDTLEALAPTPIPFIGLLGPPRRRDDLLRVLPVSTREALAARLHAPVGLDLGGRGAEAIALSIAAQLQAWHAAR